MASRRTEMLPQDNGKMFAYIKTFNPAQVTQKLRRDPTTIRRFINKYKAEKLKVYHDQDVRLLLMMIKKSVLLKEITKDRRALHEVINTLNLNCGEITAKKVSYGAEIHSHIAAKKPFVSERHGSARVSWCKKVKKNNF